METVLVLTESKEFNKHKETVIDSVIKAFDQSSSFKMTRTIIGVLIKIDSFNKEQILSVREAIKNNSQINQEYYALPVFKKVLKEKYKVVIDI